MIATAATIATLYAMINTGRDRLGSVGKRGLASLLLAATGGCCAICGDALVIGGSRTDPKRFEVCHLIPAAWFPVTGKGDRGGFITANLFAGCGSCNDKTGDRNITAAVPVLFAIPEGVIDWTPAEARRAAAPVVKITSDDHADLWAKINSLVG